MLNILLLCLSILVKTNLFMWSVIDLNFLLIIIQLLKLIGIFEYILLVLNLRCILIVLCEWIICRDNFWFFFFDLASLLNKLITSFFMWNIILISTVFWAIRVSLASAVYCRLLPTFCTRGRHHFYLMLWIFNLLNIFISLFIFSLNLMAILLMISLINFSAAMTAILHLFTKTF